MPLILTITSITFLNFSLNTTMVTSPEIVVYVDDTPISCAKNFDHMKFLEMIEDCFILDFNPSSPRPPPIISMTNIQQMSDVEKTEITMVRPRQKRVSVHTNPPEGCSPLPGSPNDTHMSPLEETEECVIIDFQPQVSSVAAVDISDDSDMYVVAENGQCYCFVCDVPAPCNMWIGVRGHCHALDTNAWLDNRDKTRKNRLHL